MKTLATDKTRNILVVAHAGEVFPDALIDALRAEAVSTGWMRASGVLRDVEMRAHAPELGGLASARHIAGPVQVMSMEGSIGMAAGDVSFGARAILARETDSGLEVLAGEIMHATIVAFEGHVVALDEFALPRALDREAGIWLLDSTGHGMERSVGTSFEEAHTHGPGAYRPPTASAIAAFAGDEYPLGATLPSALSQQASPWGEAIAASDQATRAKPAAATQRSPDRAASNARTTAQVANVTGAMPGPTPALRLRPAEDDGLMPEAGDVVQHFAFGRADVLKSDGDRLHLKVDKDGRIREIALEMLKVTRLDDTDKGKRSFRLDRRV